MTYNVEVDSTAATIARHTLYLTWRLPKRYALLGRQVHLVAFLDIKSTVETGLIPLRERATGPIGRVGIGLELHDQLVIADFTAPYLDPTQIKR